MVIDDEAIAKVYYLADIYKEESVNRFMDLYAESFRELVKGELLKTEI